MTTTFAELHQQILKSGFTAVCNPLDDFLAAELPHKYYLVWRSVWRNTVGWNKATDNITIEQIKTGAGANAETASRGLHFFHTAGLIRYEPGTWKRKISRITVLPNGLPDQDGFERLHHYMIALKDVEGREQRNRKANRHFTYKNAEFCARVQGIASLYAGDVGDDEWIEAYNRVMNGGTVLAPGMVAA